MVRFLQNQRKKNIFDLLEHASRACTFANNQSAPTFWRVLKHAGKVNGSDQSLCADYKKNPSCSRERKPAIYFSNSGNKCSHSENPADAYGHHHFLPQTWEKIARYVSSLLNILFLLTSSNAFCFSRIKLLLSWILLTSSALWKTKKTSMASFLQGQKPLSERVYNLMDMQTVCFFHAAKFLQNPENRVLIKTTIQEIANHYMSRHI